MKKLLILGWSLAFFNGAMLFVSHMTKRACGFEDRFKGEATYTTKGTNVIRVIPITREAEQVPQPVPESAVTPPAAVLPSVIYPESPVPAVPTRMAQQPKIRVAPPKPRDVCERYGLKKTYTNNKRRWRCR